MIVQIELSTKFRKSFAHVSQNVFNQYQKKVGLFIHEPFHPSLKTHALTGKLQGYYAFSINYSYRVVFQFMNAKEVLFINIGTHEIYK
jgi:addiction module RelE/StbE family toxin